MSVLSIHAPGTRLPVATAALAPALTFGALWLLGAAVLVVSGNGLPLDGVAIVGAYLLLGGLTVGITAPAPAAHTRARRLAAQLAIILGVIALTAWNGLVFHQVVPSDASLPVWTPLVAWLESAGDSMFANGNYVANPVTYAVLPLALLLVLGVRMRDLGFGRGHRVGRVVLLWAIVPVGWLVFAVATGQLSGERVGRRLVSNIMQNGFWEEFLLRGALQTRLRSLASPAWAIVIQAIVFGVWHVGLGYSETDGGLLPAVASTIVHQATIGLAFGIVFERTRNLLAPSIAHVLANSMG